MKLAAMSDLLLEFERGTISGHAWEAVAGRRAATPHHPQIGPMLDDALGAEIVVMAGDIDVRSEGDAYAESPA